MNFLDWILYRLNSKIARNLSSSILILHANFQRPARASACKFSTHLAKLDRNFKPPTVLCKCRGSLQANFQAWSQYCRRACSPLPRCLHSNFQPPLKSLHANFHTCCKSLHANVQSPLASLHATSWKFACNYANFHCLVRNELKKAP